MATSVTETSAVAMNSTAIRIRVIRSHATVRCDAARGCICRAGLRRGVARAARAVAYSDGRAARRPDIYHFRARAIN